MSNVVARIKDFVGGPAEPMISPSEFELAQREAESQRIANNPDELADIGIKAIKRHNVLTIQELEEALDAERREFQALEQTVRDVINVFQQECAPLVHQLHDHTANMAALREML